MWLASMTNLPRNLHDLRRYFQCDKSHDKRGELLLIVHPFSLTVLGMCVANAVDVPNVVRVESRYMCSPR